MYIHYFTSVTCGVIGEKKNPFFLLLDSFLVSPHLLPHFVLCKELCSVTIPSPAPGTQGLKNPYPCLVWPSHSQLEKPSFITDFGQKSFLRERGAAPRVGLAWLGLVWEAGAATPFTGIKSGLKLNLTLFTLKA